MEPKEINFNNNVSIKKIERKLNQFLSTIENNFLIMEGTGIKKSIITNVDSAADALIFKFQAKLESSLPDKKNFRAFIYSKILALYLEEEISSIYGIKQEDIINNFKYEYSHSTNENGLVFSVDYLHLTYGEFRYMDTIKIFCYNKTKILNGEEITKKFSEYLSKIKRELLIEIINYNRMKSEFNAVMLFKEKKHSLEFWLTKDKNEDSLLLQVKKEKNIIDQLKIDIKEDINELFFHQPYFMNRAKEFLKSEKINNELKD